MQYKILMFLNTNEPCSAPAHFQTFLHFESYFCNRKIFGLLKCGVTQNSTKSCHMPRQQKYSRNAQTLFRSLLTTNLLFLSKEEQALLTSSSPPASS